jgi:DNA-binding IclR family transcriptional regulator
VKTAERTFEILELLYSRDGARVAEVSDELDVAASTVHRHLTTLERREYLVKEGDEYHLGLRFLEFGEHARDRKHLYDLARVKVEKLAEETDERVVFVVEEHGQAVYVHRATGNHAVKVNPGPGKRIPIHATASGKVILASMARESVEEIIDRRGLEPITDNTITDRKNVFEELDDIRDRGYAVIRLENARGVRALAVPVQPTEWAVGALTISGPTERMKDEQYEQEILNKLLGDANEIEVNVSGRDWSVAR